MQTCDDQEIQYQNQIDYKLSVPALETHYDVIYLPISDNKLWEHDEGWGLYDSDGRLIEAAAYRRRGNLIGQSNQKKDVEVVKLELSPKFTYIYGGNLINHFGHFLISTLSRFWIVLKMDISCCRIVCHAAGNPDGWFSHRFVREIFDAIGLTRDHFIVFKRPTRIPEILVPRPCCQEHDFVHNIYAELGNTIGRGLLRSHNLPPAGPPIWLAKYNLPHGIQGFINERHLTEILASRGVEIIHPQDLLLAQQVMLFATRPTIMGTVGSAFHASVLWPPENKIVCLNPYQFVNSNCAIADKANQNQITYIRTENRIAENCHARVDRYDCSLEIHNIEETANIIMNKCL